MTVSMDRRAKVWYNDSMAFRSLRIGLALLALSLPLPVSAYLLPEDILENNQYLLPPTHVEAPLRVRIQQKTSADRREREQKVYFAEQHPDPPQKKHTADTDDTLDDFLEDEDLLDEEEDDEDDVSDTEVLRTVRQLDRIEKRQRDIYSPRVLRSRAPMTDTGPASILLAVPFLAAAGWTWRKAGRKL